jgi:peptide/nickel transport system ATP-binding protein/oligopeptide transport system ATP-binding protein
MERGMSEAPVEVDARVEDGAPDGALLELRDLRVDFGTGGRRVRAVDRLSYKVSSGRTLALIGESGSGKTVSSRAVMGLLPDTATVSGSVRFEGRELVGLSDKQMRRLRGAGIAMIFQDPSRSLNPTMRVGAQVAEAVRTHSQLDRRAARERAVELLDKVGIPRPNEVVHEHPHRLSGGMRQRVMIAMALSCRPKLIIADEPTTALDVTIQAQILRLMRELSTETGTAMVFITHDLELAAAVCDRTAVMYAGQIVETRASSLLDSDPLHPYTAALAAARPDIGATTHRLAAIPGRPVSAFEAPDGCPFAPRCAFAEDRCRSARPAVSTLDGAAVRCVRAQELRGRLREAMARA